MDRLDRSFFERDPVACARDLIGARFLWNGCAGWIVESEAYAAEGDPACHTFLRPSARAFVERQPPGTAYVYLNYGVHWLFNILVKGLAGSGFVLLRALEPAAGIEAMLARRPARRIEDLCAGPGKLTRALGIDGTSHGRDFLGGAATGLFPGPDRVVAACRRIGITRGRDLPWRFLDTGSAHLSRPVSAR
jgi:DNA-3-methyladenine glycosylase